MDEALTRYKARAVGQGRSGRSPAKRDHREVTFALTDEILQALDDDGVSTKAAEGGVASAEPDPPEPTNDAAATTAARDETDEDEQDARVERKRAKKRDRKERERRRAETDDADAAVVDHELRLRRIERDLLRAANARDARRRAGSTPRRWRQRRERCGVNAGRGCVHADVGQPRPRRARAPAAETPERRPGAARGGGVRAQVAGRGAAEGAGPAGQGFGFGGEARLAASRAKGDHSVHAAAGEGEPTAAAAAAAARGGRRRGRGGCR